MKRRSIHITIGFTLAVLCLTFGALTASASTPPATFSEAVVYHRNIDGFRSFIVYVNPTDVALPMRSGRFGSVAPHNFFVEENTAPGEGLTKILTSPELEIYFRIVTPVGGILQRPPLKPVTSATFYALLCDDGWNSGIVIGAIEDTVARVIGGAEISITAGTAVVLPATGPITSIENRLTFGTAGKAPIYAFPYSNHHRTYTLLAP
jgi:hypothetical protein